MYEYQSSQSKFISANQGLIYEARYRPPTCAGLQVTAASLQGQIVFILAN